ncbi:hypothetical protein ACFY04_05695 [Streptomyces sp. NPDC001549]|uniref:hypothetical protein n=1 Tax=Streptomyces sp. NPDC001549 TaxID=3364586 RepID=UPI0036D1A016
MTWADFVVNDKPFGPYDDEVPELTGVLLPSSGSPEGIRRGFRAYAHALEGQGDGPGR